MKQRTCIGCGQVKQKEELFRVVRNKQGKISVDATGNAAGRGAYICSLQCLEATVPLKRLERAFKKKVAQEDYERIVSQLSETLREA